MQGYNGWSYKRFVTAIEQDNNNRPYICRLIPQKAGVLGETDCVSGGMVFYKKRQGGCWNSKEFKDKKFSISGLDENCEYQIYITNQDNLKSSERLFRTGDVFGHPLAYHHPDDKEYSFSGKFLGSPSIVQLPNDVLVASFDMFALRTPQNLTRIFRSEDKGETWSYVCELMPCFWGSLFWHRDSLYMLATSTEYGDLLIGKSDDEGYTWTTPTVIMRGQVFSGRGCHKTAGDVLKKDGRLFASLEFGAWAYEGFYNAIISISQDSDLLKAENWTITEFIKENTMSGIEGNVVEDINGNILNILRFQENKAIVEKLSTDYEKLSFEAVIDFPLAHTKFQIKRYQDGRYFALGNIAPKRNVLALYQSNDLNEWQFVKNIVDCSDCDMEITGFQYPSFIFDGDEMLILSRTAYNGADNFHNSNYITFHKIKID